MACVLRYHLKKEKSPNIQVKSGSSMPVCFVIYKKKMRLYNRVPQETNPIAQKSIL